MTANLLILTKEKREFPMQRHLMPATALPTKKMAFTLLCCALLMLVAAPAWADPCSAPTVGGQPVGSTGFDTAGLCGVLVTVTAVDNSGNATAFSVISLGNNNPYDGVEDTLVGVQNSSSGTLNSLTLTSSGTPGAFAFDHDGPCNATTSPTSAYNHSYCPFPNTTTGYEGPVNTFTNINGTQTSGTVNFTSAIPSGGSTWFALEGTPQSIGTTQVVTNTFTPQQPTQVYIYGSGNGENSWKATTTVNNSFAMSVSATEYDGDGVCVIPGSTGVGNANDSTDPDCQLANFQGVGQSPGPADPPFNAGQTVLVPQCAKVSDITNSGTLHCVRYHVVDAPPAPGQAGSPYSSPVNFLIAYNAPEATASAAPGFPATRWVSNGGDMYDDPSDDADLCNCYPTFSVSSVRQFPYSPEDGQFVFDITTFHGPAAAGDWGGGGSGGSFNDFTLALPLAVTQSAFSWVSPLSSTGNPSFPQASSTNNQSLQIRFKLNPDPGATALDPPNHIGVAILKTIDTCAQDVGTQFLNSADVNQLIQPAANSPTLTYNSSKGKLYYQWNVLTAFPSGLYKVIVSSNLTPQQCANFTVK